MMHHTTCQRFKKGFRGFSLIEVMVALVISMILLLALATLLMETSNSHRELAKQSRQIENGTYAMLKVGDDIKHAGFYGLYSILGVADPAAMPNPCVDTSVAGFPATLQVDIRLPVQGYNNPAAAPIGCISNHKPNTDVLVIRRVNTNFNNIDVVDTTGTRLYLQSTADNVVIDTGNATPDPFTLSVNTLDPPPIVKDTSSPPLAPTFEYFTNIYYVSTCNVCPGDTIPTLYRAYLNGNGVFVNEPLVDGIEQFQVEYGLDTSGNGTPNTYVQDPTVASDLAATITAWRQVVAVRLYILARNTEATDTGGYTDQKTYNLGAFGNFTPAANDRFKRHLFTSTFKMMNI